MNKGPMHSDLQILHETDRFTIGHIFEDTYLMDKNNGEVILHDTFFGDATCGLIDLNHAWAIIAGDHLTVWRQGEVCRIDDDALKWAYAFRVKYHNTVELLTDPWSASSAIWSLNMVTLRFQKVRDFRECFGKVYREEVIW